MKAPDLVKLDFKSHLIGQGLFYIVIFNEVSLDYFVFLLYNINSYFSFYLVAINHYDDMCNIALAIDEKPAKKCVINF